MAKPSFMTVWSRIVAHQGDEFHTKTALPFTYTVDGNSLVTSRTDYPLSQAGFETAYRDVPIASPGVISRTLRGPSYVWAILHDDRIRRGDW